MTNEGTKTFHSVSLSLSFSLSLSLSLSLPFSLSYSLQGPFSSCVVIIHDNLTIVGQNNKHLLQWQMHGLKNMFLETSLNIKLPSIPWGDLSSMPGYCFESASSTRASYYHAMMLMGKINEVFIQSCNHVKIYKNFHKIAQSYT